MNGRDGASPTEYNFTLRDGELELNANDEQDIDNDMISILNYEESDCENINSDVDMVSLIDYEGSSDTDNECDYNHSEVINLPFF